jgi:hypothetical protein
VEKSFKKQFFKTAGIVSYYLISILEIALKNTIIHYSFFNSPIGLTRPNVLEAKAKIPKRSGDTCPKTPILKSSRQSIRK